jgi:hypothetical protein
MSEGEEKGRGNLRIILRVKSERVKRTWVPITSLLLQATSFVREFDGTLSVRATFEGFFTALPLLQEID